MTAPSPQPEHCEYIITDEDFDFIWQNMGDWLKVRDRINVVKSRSRPAPSPQVPTSAELIQMANKEWCNREERKGHAEAHRTFWCSGWISGFLTPNKPDWSKEHDTAIRNATLDKLYNRYVDAYLNPDNYNEINAKEVYQFIESLRHKERQ